MRHRYGYSKYKCNPLPSRQDNKTCKVNRDGVISWHPTNASIRVPSLKRGRSTWKRFYRLFPELRYAERYGGLKLKHLRIKL